MTKASKSLKRGLNIDYYLLSRTVHITNVGQCATNLNHAKCIYKSVAVALCKKIKQ